jgi:hypothetical protein
MDEKMEKMGTPPLAIVYIPRYGESSNNIFIILTK